MLRDQVRRELDNAKTKPCSDCGGWFPSFVMQFDHLPGKRKCFNLSEARMGKIPIHLVRAEMAKCEVVCANCHIRREHVRRYGP